MSVLHNKMAVLSVILPNNSLVFTVESICIEILLVIKFKQIK